MALLQTTSIIKLFLFAILFVTIYDSTESCSCMPAHPQTQYCNADYVIIARILRKSLVKSTKNTDVYKIEIKKSYKMSEKAHNYLKTGRILTPNSDSMCGVELQIGKLYVIAGRGPKIGICDYVKEYLDMTIVERRGFAGSYKKGCNCEIKPCFRGLCPLEYGTCNWSPFAKCETHYSACIPSRNITTPEGIITKCHWRRTPPYKACLSEPQLNHHHV